MDDMTFALLDSLSSVRWPVHAEQLQISALNRECLALMAAVNLGVDHAYSHSWFDILDIKYDK